MFNFVKKISVLMLIVSGSSYAELKHVNGSYFDDNGEKIFYPCTGGGEPLVIYGSTLSSNYLIVSKNKIEPIYIKEGFDFLPLEVANYAQSSENSDQFLIINSQNPATESQYVKIGIQKKDGSNFYVNTVNLASVVTNSDEQFVTNYKITINNNSISSRIIPIKLYSFQQDIGVNIFKNAKKIEAMQYTWNQKTPWTDFSHPTVSSIVKYNFKAQVTSEPHFMNGFGYWICGEEKGK